MARRRHLSPEESDLWRTVARTARSLHSPPIHLPDPSPAPEPAPLAPAKPRLSPFLLGEKHRKPEQRDLAPTLPDLLGQTALRQRVSECRADCTCANDGDLTPAAQ